MNISESLCVTSQILHALTILSTFAIICENNIGYKPLFQFVTADVTAGLDSIPLHTFIYLLCIITLHSKSISLFVGTKKTPGQNTFSYYVNKVSEHIKCFTYKIIIPLALPFLQPCILFFCLCKCC